MSDYYTWSEFVAEVKKLLPIESQRIGVGSTATDYLTSLIRQGAIDLQRAIDGFKINHETIYHREDMVQEGLAMRLVKPPQSAFRGLSIFRNDAGEIVSRFDGVAYPWAKRFDLINGVVPSNDGVCRYSIDDAGYTCYVYPMPEDQDLMVSLFWDGQKFDFKDDEQVPFSEAAALAVSYFVRSNTSLEVEDGMQNSTKYAELFERQKTKLYIDDKDKRGK